MKYFIDTEFLEGTQKTFFGKTKPTIDLISIGIVGEDSREYSAISNEFNIKEAWNRHELVINKSYPQGGEYNKVYWIRDNVLKPIWEELVSEELTNMNLSNLNGPFKFTYREFKRLINKYGKSNKQISEEVKVFVFDEVIIMKDNISGRITAGCDPVRGNPEFYAYFADYDWVVFCWIFGRMMDLPKGFPMYCKDIKQTMDDIVNGCVERKEVDNFKDGLFWLKHLDDYPTQENAHNALDDAKWNMKLFNFLKQLQI